MPLSKEEYENGKYERVGIKFANHLNVAIRWLHSNFLIILSKC
jgi:hypothetical protein